MENEIKLIQHHIKNCSDTEFVVNNLDFCARELRNKKAYINNHAKKIVEAEEKIGNNELDYFNNLYDELQQYKNNIDALLYHIETNRQQYEIDAEEKKQRDLARSLLDQCGDIIGENDAKNRQITDKIVSGIWGGCRVPDENLVLEDQTSLRELIDNISDIEKKVKGNEINIELNKVALKRSVKAAWVGALSFNMEDADLDNPTTKAKLYDIAISRMPNTKKHPEYVAVLGETYNEVKSELANKQITHYNDAKVAQLVQQFNTKIEGLNKLCEDTKNEYTRNKSLSKYVNPNSFEEVFYDENGVIQRSQSTFTPNTQGGLDVSTTTSRAFMYMPQNMDEAQAQVDYEYKLQYATHAKYHSQISQGYLQLLDTPLAPFMISDKLRNKVGAPGQGRLEGDWLHSNCMKSNDAKVFEPITPQDIEDSKKDLLDTTLNDLVHIDGSHGGSQGIENVKRYLKENPETISELFNQNPDPEYAAYLCAFISDIYGSDTRWLWAKELQSVQELLPVR